MPDVHVGMVRRVSKEINASGSLSANTTSELATRFGIPEELVTDIAVLVMKAEEEGYTEAQIAFKTSSS